MFTGIIEETGKILKIEKSPLSAKLTIQCQKVLKGTKIGDSIAVNGICLTVTSLSPNAFTADVMAETLRRSSLSESTASSIVNLERAMPADGRFGGHIVSGHIDGTGRVTEIRQEEIAVWYAISAAPDLLRYIVEKGSIALDGISLTVAAVTSQGFRVSVIPHTRQETALAAKGIGSLINIECDIVGKYIEKLLSPQDTAAPKSQLTESFLMEHGFLPESTHLF